MGASSRKNGFNSAQNQFQIIPEGPVINIVEIHIYHLFIGHPTPPVHLPWPGKTCGHDQSPYPLRSIPFHFKGLGSLGTNEAHIAFDHIPQLRDFIDAQSPQVPADPGDTPIPSQLVSPTSIRTGMIRTPTPDHLLQQPQMRQCISPGVHRSKFEATETLASLCDSLLPEKNRSARVQSNEYPDHQYHRRKQYKQQGSNHPVQQELHLPPQGCRIRRQRKPRSFIHLVGVRSHRPLPAMHLTRTRVHCHWIS